MRIRLVLLATALTAPLAATAQQRDTTPASVGSLTPAVVRQAVSRFNEATALRVTTPTTIDSGREIDGQVSALEAPLRIAGTVHGDVVAINGTVVLLPGAHVDGSILVVGGTFAGNDAAYVGGEIRVYQWRLRYHLDGSLLVADDVTESVPFSWSRFMQHNARDNGIRVRSFSTYNRVEGLPVYAGPVITRRGPRGTTMKAELYGILRSAERFEWNSENVGHRATVELRGPGTYPLVLGGRLHDIVEAIEPWQLPNSEAGLATFFLHRDYRDWFSRHGGAVYGGIAGPRGASLLLTLGDERWASQRDRGPWTLFRNSESWRRNPTVDDGRFHTARLALNVDTRNDPDDPRAGWLVAAEVERGAGRIESLGARTGGTAIPFTGCLTCGTAIPTTSGDTRYARMIVDVRRFNRLSPETQLNARFVIGGWLSGDDLPLQRSLSVSGPGALPGYDFRRNYTGDDVLNCSQGPNVPGRPAECERIALAQLEYRSDIRVDVVQRWLSLVRSGRPATVLFVDAGRGWRVDARERSRITYGSGEFPPFRSFRSDVGAGVDLGVMGFYVAKGVSIAHEPANFFVRLKHRF
jgi:cytoskeletal protein CcmA (bactofilin family)